MRNTANDAIMLWQAKCLVSKEKIKEKDHGNLGRVANQQIVMNLAGVVSALLMITVVFSFFNPD
jgi:hypothetical protein